MDRAVSRRAFITGVAGAVAATRVARAQEVPTVTKRVEKLYKVARVEGTERPAVRGGGPLGARPGRSADQQSVPHQARRRHASSARYKPKPCTPAALPTATARCGLDRQKGRTHRTRQRRLKVDPKTGKTLKTFITPGSGLYGRMSAERGDTPSGAHGLKWLDGKYWMAVPAANKVFLMEPETGEIVRSIPGPGSTPRTHGMAVDKGMLWVINSDDRAIFKLDLKDGARRLEDPAQQGRSRSARARHGSQRRPVVLRRGHGLDVQTRLNSNRDQEIRRILFEEIPPGLLIFC